MGSELHLGHIGRIIRYLLIHCIELPRQFHEPGNEKKTKMHEAYDINDDKDDDDL